MLVVPLGDADARGKGRGRLLEELDGLGGVVHINYHNILVIVTY